MKPPSTPREGRKTLAVCGGSSNEIEIQRETERETITTHQAGVGCCVELDPAEPNEEKPDAEPVPGNDDGNGNGNVDSSTKFHDEDEEATATIFSKPIDKAATKNGDDDDDEDDDKDKDATIETSAIASSSLGHDELELEHQHKIELKAKIDPNIHYREREYAGTQSAAPPLLQSIATPDSMAFSMGIYSMDQPPTTPIIPSDGAPDRTPSSETVIAHDATNCSMDQPPTTPMTSARAPNRTPFPSGPATTTAAKDNETETKRQRSSTTDARDNYTTPILPEKTKTPNTIPLLQPNINSNNNNSNNNSLQVPNTPSVFLRFNGNNKGESSTITPLTTNANTTAPAKTSATTKTLAALFGGPSIGNAPGGYSESNDENNKNLNNLAAQHDYTLVGDSPYETTYDPQSPYYYNRVYGQLYITTVSVMFRGKAFGPIGAIPYERRLLLPFGEVSTVEAYKTTSVKITMNDGESYVFKSFANREAMIRLLRRTQKKCFESRHTPRRQRRIAAASKEKEVLIHPMNTPNSNNHSNNHRSLETITRVLKSETTSVLSQEQEDERDYRLSHTPNSNASYRNSSSKNHKNNQDGRRRSQSMPSSLRASKTARAPSVSLTTTPQQNSGIVRNRSNDAVTNKRNNTSRRNGETMTNEKRRTLSVPRSQRMTANSLRLSLMDDGNDVDVDVDGQDLATLKKSKKNESVPDPTRPRRLFDVATNNNNNAGVLVSPPRRSIAQRRQPKTPQIPAVNETSITNNSSNNSSKVSQQRTTTPRDRDQLGDSKSTIGTLASIPSIPTVPTLNTPEPRSQQRVIKIDQGRSRVIPFPIPEILNDDSSPPSAGVDRNKVGIAPLILDPVTPIVNHSPTPNAETIRMEKSWKDAALSTNPKTQKDWTVALEPTRLPNCTLDDWFDLFFSDDAVFSLARYQLEHVGDRDVSFHQWSRKTPKKSSDETTDHDGIPELEREIAYIHPIGGMSMIGPSEAETFRVQSLKRYGNHGAILKNVTTVGKGIPMGDCFRVEDKWIIEKDPSEPLLTISVSFRVVFVKRTMFRGIIQKNTLSETKQWFQGYAKMLQTALESPRHQELREQRLKEASLQLVVPEEISGTPTSSAPSLTLSMKETSTKTTESSILRGVNDYSELVDGYNNDNSSSSSNLSDGQFSGRSCYRRRGRDHSSRSNGGETGKNRLDNSSRLKYYSYNNNSSGNNSGSGFWIAWGISACVVVGLLMLAMVALWLQVRSVGTSLSLVEGRLVELQAQNKRLLQTLEEQLFERSTAAVAVGVTDNN